MATRRVSRIPQSTAIIIAVATLVVGFIAGRITAPKPAADASPKAVAAANQGANTASANAPAKKEYQEAKLDLDPSPSKGAADAPVVIYEFSDFECPFCSRVNPTMDKIASTYPNDVKIVFKHRPLPFHKKARLASIASMAAARQGHFWKYHDVLFANAKKLDRANLIKFASEIPGMDMAKFKKDLDDKKLALKVDNDDAAAQAVGATGTPAFYINGVKLSGAKPFAEFKAEIDKQLAKAKTLEVAKVPRGQIARRLTAQAGGTAAQFVKYIIDERPAPKPKQAAKRQPPKEDTKTVWNVPVDAKTEHVKGAANAQVTIVEFSDFECPFCSRVLPTYEKIMKEYDGKVRKVFKHTPLPFHKNAPLAHEASLAAGEQGKFWEMHKLIFSNIKKIKRADLEAHAATLKLDMDKFKAALDSGKFKKKIEADMELGKKVGARGTPNAYINGRQLKGAKGYDDFKKIIDEELAKTGKMLKDGVKPEELYAKLVGKGKQIIPPPPLDPKVNDIKVGNSPTKGIKNAKIQVVEWSDFQCPYCGRIGPPLKQLVAKYPEQVSVTFKQFPLSFHKQAFKAAEASLAAGAQGKFWEMHDILFANMKALHEDKLMVYATQLGLDMDTFKADLTGGKYAAQVRAEMAEGSKVGVRGTPSIYVNGRKWQAQGRTLADFEKVFIKELGLKAAK